MISFYERQSTRTIVTLYFIVQTIEQGFAVKAKIENMQSIWTLKWTMGNFLVFSIILAAFKMRDWSVIVVAGIRIGTFSSLS
jgi:hypothetical protein